MPKTTLQLAVKMPDSLGCCSPAAVEADEKTRVSYPTVWLHDVKGVEDLPDEFTATVKFKKTASSEEKTTRDGVTKEVCSATLELHSMEFDSTVEKEEAGEGEDTAESSLDEFLKVNKNS